jgi:prenyl protein peptidase
VAKEGKRRLSSIVYLADQAERMPLVFPVPPLSTRGANLVAFFFSASYVVSLYLSKHARLKNSPKPDGLNASASQNRTRDDPSVIKARMVAASTSTILSCVVLFLLVWHIVDDLENVSGLNLVTAATQRNPPP